MELAPDVNRGIRTSFRGGSDAAGPELETLEPRMLLSGAPTVVDPIDDVAVLEDSTATVVNLADVFEDTGGTGAETVVTFNDASIPIRVPEFTTDGVTFASVDPDNTFYLNSSLASLFLNAPGEWGENASGGNALVYGFWTTDLTIDLPSPANEVSFLLLDAASTQFTVTGRDADGASLGDYTFTTPAAGVAVVQLPFADVKTIEIQEDTYNTSVMFLDDLRFTGPGAAGPLALEVWYNTNAGLVTTNLDGTELTLSYVPDQNGSANITVRATNTAAEYVDDTFTVTVKNLVDLSGRVFHDLDNDGAYEEADGEAGIDGVTVQLVDQPTEALIDEQVTADGGTYAFDANLSAGTYKIVEVPPAGYVDGKETVGSIGGWADNSQDSNEIADIVVGEPGTTADGTGYNFAEIEPSSIQGMVWEDFNNDGEVNFGEKAIEGVEITVTGTDDRGSAVNLPAQLTDANGIYEFVDLRPGTHTIAETQPAGFQDGQDVPGLVNGIPAGVVSANDVFSVTLPQPGSAAENFNFAERPVDGAAVTAGQTAGIGFWQNKHGQKLIQSLNGGGLSTQLGDWLAATFPNMYGTFAHKTNDEVASMYKQLFKLNGKTSPGGPPKLDAQVLAVALAAYVTNVNLAGTTAAAYGFNVTETGLAAATFNIGDSGAAFGVADGAVMNVLDILQATDAMTTDGLLYDGDGQDGIDPFERLLRELANEVYSAINEQGDS